MEDISSTEDGVKGEAVQEALQRMRSTVGEVRPEAVATNIFHTLFIGKGRDCGGGVVSAQCLIQEDKVCKPSPGCGMRSLEGGECGL